MGPTQAPASVAASVPRLPLCCADRLAPSDTEGHLPAARSASPPGLTRPCGRAVRFCARRHPHAAVCQLRWARCQDPRKLQWCSSRPLGGQPVFLPFSLTLDDWPTPGFPLWPQMPSIQGEGSAVDTGTRPQPLPSRLVDPDPIRSSCLLPSSIGTGGHRLVRSTCLGAELGTVDFQPGNCQPSRPAV